ncbi:MAG: hypothetical protein Q8N99_01720, partial [Nanoarchaeota archaeon]|nr:hypothetical protein [Nanoarchaeota archaeon]
IKKTMGHPHLKVWVCDRPLFLGCSRIENCNICYDHMINHEVFNSQHKKKREMKKNKTKFKKNNLLKWILLIVILVLTLYFAYTGFFNKIILKMDKYGIIGIYITGIFFGYSIASVPATVLFAYFSDFYNPFLIAFIGALGVLTENMIVFGFIKKELPEEITEFIQDHGLRKLLKKKLNWLITLIAFVILVTPLPNELGIYLLTLEHFSPKIFMVFSFCSSFIGILIISLIGGAII